MNFIHDTLGLLCDEHSRELERQAGELHARLHYARTDDIMEFGLHEYLMEFLEHISRLGAEINRVFLVPSYHTAIPMRVGVRPNIASGTTRASDVLR
jgi:uncharacterized alpha-E superfamily protein